MKQLKIKDGKKKSKWSKILTLMIVGCLSSGLLSNYVHNHETKMQRITRRLEEKFGIMEIIDIDCNEHNCWNTDGTKLILENGKELSIHQFNNEIFADFLLDTYENEVVFPDYKYAKHKTRKGLDTFVIQTNETMTQEEFNEAVDNIIESLDKYN